MTRDIDLRGKWGAMCSGVRSAQRRRAPAQTRPHTTMGALDTTWATMPRADPTRRHG